MNTATYKSSDMRRALCLGGLLAMLCVVPLWADPDIANNVTTPYCDDSVLESDTGPVGIEINWAPNEIDLHWYNGDTEITSGVPTSCIYDAGLTPPQTIPTKEGYTFKGWRAYSCDFSDLDTSTAPTTYAYISFNGSPSYVNGGLRTPDTFRLTENGTWAAGFSNGFVVGTSTCSTTSVGIPNPGTPNMANNGIYCWCKITGFALNDKPLCSMDTFRWIQNYPGGSNDNCKNSCARYCGDQMRSWGSFRANMLVH